MLKRIRIQNYKSLKDVTINLRPLNVLVGANAAGKSNVLDALAFLRDLCSEKLQDALERRGGFADVVWGGQRRLPIRFEVDGKTLVSGAEREFFYTVEIGLDISEKPIVQDERATMDGEQDHLFELAERQVRYVDRKRNYDPDFSILGQARAVHSIEVFGIQQFFRNWSVYDFQKPKIVQREAVRKQVHLASDGTNAASLLHSIRNEEVDAFERLESLLKAAIPEVERLLTPPDENGQVYIAFKERGIPSRIPAWSLSEGSALLVANLLALFGSPSSALVAIESPEGALHPYLMEHLAELLRMAAQERQVIITTHSPFLLDQLPPESLLIVSKDKGQTKVTRPKKSQALAQALNTLGLGEMWMAGHLGGTP